MCIVKRSKIDVSRTVVQALFTIGELWQVLAVLTVLIHQVRALNMYSSFVHTNFALIPSHHNEYECKEFFSEMRVLATFTTQQGSCSTGPGALVASGRTYLSS